MPTVRYCKLECYLIKSAFREDFSNKKAVKRLGGAQVQDINALNCLFAFGKRQQAGHVVEEFIHNG